MIFIISPAKTLNTDKIDFKTKTTPYFINKAKKIIDELRKLDSVSIQKKLKVNEKIADLNLERYKNWKEDETPESKQVIFSYNGHLFKNINIQSLKPKQLEYLQNNLLIFSTLYGALKPFDLIMPYRLDFLAKIKINDQNLYDYWKEDITNYLNSLDDDTVINLASNEYFKTINTKKLNKNIIDIVFKELKNDKYKVISMSAKKMRGKFINFVAKNQINDIEKLKEFNDENYKFSKKESNDNCFTFLKD